MEKQIFSKMEKFEKTPSAQKEIREKPKDFEELKKEIKNWEIAELYEPMREIVRQLREDIEAEKHTSLLIDDTSGRIPGLILGKTINLIRKQEGKEPIPSFFYAGGGISAYQRIYEQRIGKHFKNIKPRLGERTLVVTEFIASGESIRRDAENLEKKGIDYDIAVVAFWARKKYEEFQKEFLQKGVKIFWGGEEEVPPIYGSRAIAGVVKRGYYTKKPGAIGLPAKFKLPKDKNIPLHIRSAREDVNLIAKNLAFEYF